MNNFDEWSQIISKFLKAEADLLTSVARHEIAADSTRAAFIRGVLEPFLPSSYAIGSGRVIDSAGKSSDHIDIVIYRRDFPRLNLPGSSDVFLYESVLATIEVRTKLIRKTLFDTLDTCASIAALNPDISALVLKSIAAQNKLTLNDQNKYVHEHPMLTDRFNLIGRPPSFIYGFSGFQTSPNQLNDNFEIWLEQRQKNNLEIDLKSLPAVIATQGCIGWRNAAPLSANSNHLFGIGADTAPIRLIVLQLLYQLNRRLKVTPDGYGLKPSVDAYLNQMAPPKIQFEVGKATHASKNAPKVKNTGSTATKVKAPMGAARPPAKSQPAPVSKPDPAAKVAPESKSVPAPRANAESKPVIESKPALAPRVAPNPKPVAESRPVPVPKAAAESKPAPAPKAAASRPAPEPKAMTQPNPVAESKPAPDAESVFDSKPVFETMPVARPAPGPESEVTAEPKTSAIPKPALGAMYHADPTLGEMPIPDARLVPEPEPEAKLELEPASESDPFIQTMQISTSDSKPAPEAAPAAENKPAAEPEPYVETIKTTAQDLESEAEDDPFLQTMRIPTPTSEPKMDPFGKTIPGLQTPSKSIH